MALKSNFNESRFDADVKEQAGVIYDQIVNSFIMAGEQFIINARTQAQDHGSGQNEDVTANLRNSISYYLFHNGELIVGKEPGSDIGKTNEGKMSASEITAINKQAIQDVVSKEGFQLILVAGMNYASWVESKGYNVISYQADLCLVDITQYLERKDIIKQGSSVQLEEAFNP